VVSVFLQYDPADGTLIVHSDASASAVSTTTSGTVAMSASFPPAFSTPEMHPHTHTEYVAVELVHSPQFSDGRHTVEITPLDVVGIGTVSLLPVAWATSKRRARTSRD
jgi:hypothetical protein